MAHIHAKSDCPNLVSYCERGVSLKTHADPVSYKARWPHLNHRNFFFLSHRTCGHQENSYAPDATSETRWLKLLNLHLHLFMSIERHNLNGPDRFAYIPLVQWMSRQLCIFGKLKWISNPFILQSYSSLINFQGYLGR